jgi:Na+/proline symporter
MHLSTWAYILFAGALVSAILSTVNSALLVSASLISHNVFIPIYPRMSERMKVRIARVFVILFGIVAYVLALHAQGVYELVEDASSFGSAGILVLMVFGLFTRFGGPVSAYTSLMMGTAAWLFGEHYLETETPYLLSLLTAFLCYIVCGFVTAAPETAGEPVAVLAEEKSGTG